MDKYDVVVLGGGPGGYVAAIRAAQTGLKTAIIEMDLLGGTCLNRGCIPTKTFVQNAEILHSIKKAKSRGIIVDKPMIDIAKMIESKNAVIKQLRNGIEVLLKSNNVKIFKGKGRVATGNIVNIENSEENITISYDNLIIATGSENFIPPITGIDDGILTSTELLDVEKIPESLAIIGGGVIGCEFASIFNALGSKVTIIEMMPRLVANMDEDISLQLQKSLKKKKINIMVNSGVNAVEHIDDSYKMKITDKINNDVKEVVAEKILMSVGRRPNLEGLEVLNLEYDGRYIKIDEKMRTSCDNVYAIGDITGKVQLAHVASAQGRVAAEAISGKNESKCNLDVVPGCIYTIPEIGSVGLTEAEAREKYGEDILVGRFPVAALGKAIAMGEPEGSFKVIAEAGSRKLLGMHIFGSNATDIIMEAAVILQAEGTLDMITDTIHAHPTIAEGIMEVAHEAEGHCIHMPSRKQ